MGTKFIKLVWLRLLLLWRIRLGAAAFTLHPLQAEPVAWVSGLRDMLSGLATTAALWQYVAFARAPDRRKAAVRYALATTLFVCAVLSKPSAVVLPILAALLDRGVLGRAPSRCAKSLAPWFALAVAFGLATRMSQDATHIRALMPAWSRPLVALDSLAFYLYKLVWPRVLSPDYGRAPDLALARGWLYWTWLAPAATALAIGLSPGRRISAVCALFFAAAPLPVLGLVPFIHQDLSTVADRYVYMSLLGPALALAWGLRAARRRLWWAAAMLLVAVLGARSRLQAAIWRDTGTLFGHIVAHNPDSGIAHGNLANFLADHGALKDAEFHYREALRLRPGEGMPLNNLGNHLARQGRTQEAIVYYEQALRDGLPGNVADAHNALGVVLSGLGRTAEAERHYDAALALAPDRERVHANLGRLLADQGRYDQAVAHYRWALRLRPDFPQARLDLGRALALAGRPDEARKETAAGLGAGVDSAQADGVLGDYLQMRGDYARALPFYQSVVRKAPAMAQARNSLGFTLSKLGRPDEALAQYREAARLDPRLLAAQFNLGSLLLQRGETDAAVAALSKAAQAVPDAYELQHNLGIALLRAGRKPDAILRFRQALQLRPGFEPSRKILEELTR